MATRVYHIKINPLIPQLVEKFPTFRGTLRFVTVFTRANWLCSDLAEASPHCLGHFNNFFYLGAATSAGPGPPHYRGLTNTLRHAMFVRTALDE